MRSWGLFLAAALALAPFASHAADLPPRFVVDPNWPKPLPNRWVTGEVGGVCVDREDHVIGVNRASLTEMELKLGEMPAPVVIEYDADGELARAWGDPKIMPKQIHGCFVDAEDNIWIGGSGDGSCRNGRTTASRCCCRSAARVSATMQMRSAASQVSTKAQPC